MKRIAFLFALTLALATPALASNGERWDWWFCPLPTDEAIPSTLATGCATAEKDEGKKGDFSLLAPPAKVVWAVAKGSAKGSFWVAKKGAKGAAFAVTKVAHFLF